jgi:hypothetical protein
MAAVPSVDLDCKRYGGGESTAATHQLDGQSPSTSGGEVAFTFLHARGCSMHAHMRWIPGRRNM